MEKASIIGISRLRIRTDGQGVTALIAFHGCPLHCKYCPNPICHAPQSKVKRMSAEEMMQEVEKDELYYIATNGGVTFGGGEPLLNSSFIKEVLELGAKRWHVTLETSLHAPQKHIIELLPYIDEYIVDIKDLNSETYLKYTERSIDQMKSNLEFLIANGLSKKIICRVPLIPGYNNQRDQEENGRELSRMGIENINLFTYNTEKV